MIRYFITHLNAIKWKIEQQQLELLDKRNYPNTVNEIVTVCDEIIDYLKNDTIYAVEVYNRMKCREEIVGYYRDFSKAYEVYQLYDGDVYNYAHVSIKTITIQ